MLSLLTFNGVGVSAQEHDNFKGLSMSIWYFDLATGAVPNWPQCST